MSDIFKDFDKKNEIPRVKIPKFATGGICNDAIFPKLDVFSQIDEIVKDIRDRQDNDMAMEFTKCIGELLKKNGVVPKLTEYTRNFETDNTFETRYGVSIDELDFSEHDSMLKGEIEKLKSELEYKKRNINYLRTRCMEDATDAFDSGAYGRLTIVGRRVDLETENEKLKQRIAELESKETVDLPFDPLETANYLINATYERETNSLERVFAKVPDKVNSDRYTIDDLEQIAEHLLIYCKHNKECEE